MKRFLFLALVALSTSATAKIVDGVAAVVSGRVITLTELESATTARSRMGAPGKDPKKDALEGLIENALIQKEAERLGIAATKGDAESAAADIRKRNNMDEPAFREALAAQGMPWGDYLEQLRAQILKVKVAGQVLRSRLRPDDDDLREFYLKHAADFCHPDQVRLKHIEVSGGRESAETARRRLEAGEPPEAVAKDVTGGKSYIDMGILAVGTLSEAVRDAVRNASAAGVSPVVELGGNCHLFLVSEKTTARVPPFGDLPSETRELVKSRYYEEKEEELYRTWIDALKEKAKIERLEG